MYDYKGTQYIKIYFNPQDKSNKFAKTAWR